MFSKLSLVASFASVLFFATIHGSQCDAKSVHHHHDRANYWFAFGGSYTARGFNSHGTLPSPGNPLGNPAYPGKTVVGGTNYVDVLTTELNRSLILTYDYAVSGATIDSSLVKLGKGKKKSVPLTTQVSEFLEGAGKKPKSARWTSENALFSIFVGINDITGSYHKKGSNDAFNKVLMDAYFKEVDKLYAAGARNFLFINIPPIERAPANRKHSKADRLLEKNTVLDFNKKLAEQAKAFQDKHSSVKTWIWDSNAAINNILDNYKKFGFNDITHFGHPGDYWGNNFHPCSKAQTILAKDIAKVVKGTRWF